jgi:hypothetical protein
VVFSIYISYIPRNDNLLFFRQLHYSARMVLACGCSRTWPTLYTGVLQYTPPLLLLTRTFTNQPFVSIIYKNPNAQVLYSSQSGGGTHRHLQPCIQKALQRRFTGHTWKISHTYGPGFSLYHFLHIHSGNYSTS